MIKSKTNQFMHIKESISKNGFSLVDAILSLALLSSVITYGIYFSSVRLSTVYNSNLTASINKEIERDIERLKSGFWSMFFEEDNECDGQYCFSKGEPLPVSLCSDFESAIVNSDFWEIEKNSTNKKIQSWSPSSQRSKVFKGQPVTISRELTVDSPLGWESLNKTIASISYRVQWSEKNIHWLSISLSPEAHSWCGNLI